MDRTTNVVKGDTTWRNQTDMTVEIRGKHTLGTLITGCGHET